MEALESTLNVTCPTPASVFLLHYGTAPVDPCRRKIAGPMTICALTQGADACRVL